VSGGYEDDADYGKEILYTGHGGNDPSTGQQVADQTLTRQNLALAVSADRGLPIRVVRGAGGDPEYSPSSGYRYDGTYYIESYGRATGRSGFNIYRFRLVKSPPTNPVTNPEPGAPPGQTERRYSTVQRLVRNTAVTQWVKELYEYRCQVCGTRIETSSGPYAEGAHVRPVGRPHNGPDEAENVLCLCPNHHVLLDRGVITFDNDFNVVEIATGDTLGPLELRDAHGLLPEYAQYQRDLHAGPGQP
jgi:putative restriction endonuclease